MAWAQEEEMRQKQEESKHMREEIQETKEGGKQKGTEAPQRNYYKFGDQREGAIL